jgi:hypothetical protein
MSLLVGGDAKGVLNGAVEIANYLSHKDNKKKGERVQRFACHEIEFVGEHTPSILNYKAF